LQEYFSTRSLCLICVMYLHTKTAEPATLKMYIKMPDGIIDFLPNLLCY